VENVNDATEAGAAAKDATTTHRDPLSWYIDVVPSQARFLFEGSAGALRVVDTTGEYADTAAFIAADNKRAEVPVGERIKYVVVDTSCFLAHYGHESAIY
jgi:hypothetical protein